MTFEQLQQHFRDWLEITRANHSHLYKVDKKGTLEAFQWTKAMRRYVLDSGVYEEYHWHYNGASRIYTRVVMQQLINAETRSSNL